jgi:catalase
MVSHLLNIDGGLARTVAGGLGLALPKAAKAARPTRQDLPASDALSIVKRATPGLEGRKLGLLLTDGADAKLVAALIAGATKAKAVYEVIAPKIGGVTLSDGQALAAKHKIDGGPSVLFDAVAIVASEEGAALLAGDAAAKDFVTDAFNHCKYIGYSEAAALLFEKTGLAANLDNGCVPLFAIRDVAGFFQDCATLRFWDRELKVDLDAKSG